MEKARTRRLWTFLAAMAAIMWGISGLFAKGLFNISSKITPMWLTQIRLIVSGIVLLISVRNIWLITCAIILFHVYSGG